MAQTALIKDLNELDHTAAQKMEGFLVEIQDRYTMNPFFGVSNNIMVLASAPINPADVDRLSESLEILTHHFVEDWILENDGDVILNHENIKHILPKELIKDFTDLMKSATWNDADNHWSVELNHAIYNSHDWNIKN